MAVPYAIVRSGSVVSVPINRPLHGGHATKPKALEFARTFRGRELTRKDRRLSSGLLQLDNLLDGGIVRGRISEIIGRSTSGKTTLAARFMASATRRREAAAWIDSSGAFDPASMALADVDLSRVLWVSFHDPGMGMPQAIFGPPRPAAFAKRQFALLKAAELILEAGGFGLLVIDFGEPLGALSQSAALRIARAAERTGTAVIVLAAHRMCGTFVALSLVLDRNQACFSRLAPGAPALFDGLTVEATVVRNKLGAFGQRTILRAMLDGVECRSAREPNPVSPANSSNASNC